MVHEKVADCHRCKQMGLLLSHGLSLRFTNVDRCKPHLRSWIQRHTYCSPWQLSLLSQKPSLLVAAYSQANVEGQHRRLFPLEDAVR